MGGKKFTRPSQASLAQKKRQHTINPTLSNKSLLGATWSVISRPDCHRQKQSREISPFAVNGFVIANAIEKNGFPQPAPATNPHPSIDFLRLTAKTRSNKNIYCLCPLSPPNFTTSPPTPKPMSILRARSSATPSCFPTKPRKHWCLIYPGKYHFGTLAAEHMEIVAGACQVVLDGKTGTVSFTAGPIVWGARQLRV